ncbi:MULTISPECIES: outer membrane beta-barrel protein [Parabacteroides]|uniref:Outer membrane protein beta-barrel domain-containing protein n=1 Tax=Parabacteroides chinchillae TaxID=871327 RepID=A0A8G2BU82_9BACT|nr:MULTISPECIES: outer membrane beta-barrel protein [Parabacteroides]SEF52422.1 Outer membrane protein beta-barrel domain-containing protein [Parabacteroides chinchillae]
MKKFVIMIMLAVISLGAYSQTEQGRSSVGFNIGYGFDDIGNATLGLDYRYCILDDFRIAPSLTYHVKNNTLSAWAIDVNAHYVVKLSEMFGFYPLAGLDMSFWKSSLGQGLSVNATRFGANIGLGGEVYATNNLSVGLEVKYLIIKDLSRPMVGVRVGYNF